MFSLEARPRSLTATLPAGEFDGNRAVALGKGMAERFGARAAGSRQDAAAAAYVAGQLERYGFAPRVDRFRATTTLGERRLVNVIGERVGAIDRKIVLLASRDGVPGRSARVGAVETGVMLELARVLDGRSPRHTIVIASVGGGPIGAAGAARWARGAAREALVDAVIVLRNLAIERPRARSVLAASNRARLPNQTLLLTAQRAVVDELGVRVTGEPLFGQIARLAFPAALGEQAVIGATGLNTVALSPGGEPLVPPAELAAASPALRSTVTGYGRATLRTLTALDAGASKGAFAKPRTALVARDKLVPGWAVALFTGCLLLPLLVAAVDAFARARRQGAAIGRAIGRPPLFAVPPFIGVLAARVSAAIGIGPAAPSAPPDLAVASPGTATIALTVAIILLVGCGWAGAILFARARRMGAEYDCALALWICAEAVLVWLISPFAALLALPAAHLLLLMLLAETRPPRPAITALVVIAIVPAAAVLGYYVSVFAIPVGDIAWWLELLVAAGHTPIIQLAAIALFAGTTAAATAHLLRGATEEDRSGAIGGRLPLIRPARERGGVNLR